jgi:hypothetical protein
MSKKYLVPEANIVYEENGGYYAVLASWILQQEGTIWVRNGVIIIENKGQEEKALMEVAEAAYPGLEVLDVQYTRLADQFERLEIDIGDNMIASTILEQFDDNVDKRGADK